MSRKTKNPLSNKYRKPLLTHAELMKVLSMRTHLSEASVRKVYSALIEYIVEDLKCNGKTRLQWLGSFYADMSEGGIRKVPSKDGKVVEKYCAPRRKAYFTPADTFLDNLNEDLGVNSLRAVREQYKKGQLIETGSPLKIERQIAVRNAIQDVATRARLYPQQDDFQFEEEDLTYGDEEEE